MTDDGDDDSHEGGSFAAPSSDEASKLYQQINDLQEQLQYEQDARREDRFAGIVALIALLNVTFFSVMPSFGGPIALLVLELLILFPLARRLGMEEVVKILSRVLNRIAGNSGASE